MSLISGDLWQLIVFGFVPVFVLFFGLRKQKNRRARFFLIFGFYSYFINPEEMNGISRLSLISFAINERGTSAITGGFD
jgi:hypothetical protein